MVVSEPFDVTVTVDADGALHELAMLRWGDPDPGGLAEYPFGGSVDSHTDLGGVIIATAGRVGW